jgi:hypothetical protein
LRAVGGNFDEAKKQNMALEGELRTVAANNPEADELARTRKRIALLKARPEGVTDARMKPIAPSGRATPEATCATLLAAIYGGDLATAKRLITFRDAPTEQQRAEFMANFDEAIRRRYPTPEDVFAAANLGLGEGATPMQPRTAFQVFKTEELFPNVFQMDIWLVGPGGERRERFVFVQTPDGWAPHFRPLTKTTAAGLRKAFDAETGLPKPIDQ